MTTQGLVVPGNSGASSAVIRRRGRWYDVYPDAQFVASLLEWVPALEGQTVLLGSNQSFLANQKPSSQNLLRRSGDGCSSLWRGQLDRLQCTSEARQAKAIAGWALQTLAQLAAS
ncbi:MAG: hypothetical protein U0003_01800 [Vampirovibrionales bacterium]